ncbi:MAG: hypothetical protein WC169_09565 [Dehalococcoidia bacterium]|jgi:uncharacterized membrane protein YqjE
MKFLKLLGNIYLALGLLVLLALFIYDCVANDKFLLHFIGIVLVIPAIIFTMWRLSEDIEGCLNRNQKLLSELSQFRDSLWDKAKQYRADINAYLDSVKSAW